MPVDLPQVFIVASFAWIVIFLVALTHAMSREDLDPVSRLTWVIVLIFVPFFGVVLYALARRIDPQPFGSSGSDVAGTPWADNPGFKRSESKDY